MDPTKYHNSTDNHERGRAVSPRTLWRVLGVPAAFDKERLKLFLQYHPIFQVKSSSNSGPSADAQLEVTVRTLAAGVIGGYQHATVRFSHVPTRLASLPQHEELELSFSDDKFGAEQYLSLDQHFSGICNLFTPPPNNHEADILAVCGLGGHAFGSYIRKGSDYMWLCDGLPQELPKARVMIYGYKSRLQQSKSFASVEHYGTSFRDSLCQELRLAGKPLILIGHSLGGLLIKHALVSLQKSGSDSSLLDHVVGALFFGVPNIGMETRSLMPMVNDQPNQHLVERINYMNADIAGPNQEFIVFLEKSCLQLYCFYETIESPTPAMDANGEYKMAGPEQCLVTPVSATGCLPQQLREEFSLPLYKTHSDLVKFAPHEESYKSVVEKLTRILFTHRNSVQKRTPMTMNNLGNVLRSQKQYQTVEEMFRKILGRQRVLGEEHADTPTTTNNLGNMRYEQYQDRRVGVVSRKASRHFGTWGYDDPKDDDPIEMRVMRDDGVKVARMHWFAKMNDDIPNGVPQYYCYKKIAKVIPGKQAHEVCFINIQIFVCEKRDPPEYKNDPNAWKITDFSLDLKGLTIPTIPHDGDRTRLYQARFEIEMILEATSVTFCGVYGRNTPDERRCPVKKVSFK